MGHMAHGRVSQIRGRSHFGGWVHLLASFHEGTPPPTAAASQVKVLQIPCVGPGSDRILAAVDIPGLSCNHGAKVENWLLKKGSGKTPPLTTENQMWPLCFDLAGSRNFAVLALEQVPKTNGRGCRKDGLNGVWRSLTNGDSWA